MGSTELWVSTSLYFTKYIPHQVSPWFAQVASLFRDALEKKRGTQPDQRMRDQGLSFGDVDACSSDSELGDVVVDDTTFGHS